jgi:hypothetical protein
MPVPQPGTATAVVSTGTSRGARVGIEAQSVLAGGTVVNPRPGDLSSAGCGTGVTDPVRAACELVLDGGGIEPTGGEEHVAVEPEIRELRDESLVAFGGAREGSLEAFFADLPRGCRTTGFDQAGDVRPLRPRRRALRDPPPEPRSKAGE